MDNEEIEKSVRLIIREFTKTAKVKRPAPSEEIMVENATRLIVNVLQNLNDIAYYCNQQGG